MLDIKFIRDHQEELKKAIQQKNISLDLDELLKLDKEKRDIQTKIEQLRAEKNQLAKQAKNGRPSPEIIARGKKIKEELSSLEDKFKEIKEKFDNLIVKVPTIPSPDTPIGASDKDNQEVYRWQEPTHFDFTPKSYLELAEELDLLDLKRGVKVAGYRGYYVKNEGVFLQLGLMMYALEKLVQKGFTPMIPPTLVREFALFGSGYFSGKKYNPEIDEIYKIENRDKAADGSEIKENKFLIGTAEPALLAYYANEVLPEEKLPLKICGFSQCYRSEIGSYGKDTKGIYRVHEFMKVEQVCLTRASLEEAEKMHQEMIKISQEMHEELELPYRLLQICTGDMSAGKYKMFDIEAWMPSRNAYGETGSASNFLDWQARRLNVKYQNREGEKKYVYMLNNTAIPSPRFLIAILENHQQKDGSVKVPKPLQKWVGKEIIEPKK